MRAELLVFSLVLACGSSAEPSASTEAPRAPVEPERSPLADGSDDERSLFQLEMALEDQAGRPFTLATLRGHPVLIAFFYSHCDTMCPTIISDLRRIEAALSPAARSALRVVMVSFDEERDTPERLTAVAHERHLELDRWTLVRGEDAEVRTLAATLGMTYRRTGEGEFAHSALFTLLDGEGQIVLTVDGTGRDMTPMQLSIERLVGARLPPT